MDEQPLAHLTTVLAASFAAGAGGVKYLVEALGRKKKQKAAAAHIAGLERIAKIYDELNQIIASDSNITRVMVIRSSNSGSIPAPGCRIFIRVLHEAYRSLTDSIIHSNLWDERQADQHYITLVREVAQTGEAHLKASELPEEAALKALYDASGTDHSVVFRLKLTGTEMIYLSVNYRNDTEPPAIARAILENSTANLRTLFS